MKCPHCIVEFHDEPKYVWLGKDSESIWVLEKLSCPNPTCKKDIFSLLNAETSRIDFSFGAPVSQKQLSSIKDSILVRPKGVNRPPTPVEVPQKYADDYKEACLVLSDSPKASAALSRRSLQLILKEKAGFKEKDLFKQIQSALDSKTLPTHIAESIDGVRNIGNFAAHPIKSLSTGEIFPVEPGEAEWNLEVIEMLFDFYFTQPERTRLRREALNSKLKEAGKPVLK